MNEAITESRLYSKEYAGAYRVFYEAVLKLIVVLIHDFSSFLSAFSLEQKVGYPKYYKLNFDKPRLNYYLNGDSS